MTGAVAPGIHRIELPLGNRRNAIYLVEGAESLLLFDTGVTGQLAEYLPPYLASIGRDADEIGYVVVSHCDIDHWGGSGDARSVAPRAVVWCHRDDRALIESTDLTIAARYQEFVDDHGIGWDEEFRTLLRERANPTRVDAGLVGGEKVDLGSRTVEILHLPGHSSGHLGLWDATSRALVVADAVLGDSMLDLDGVPSSPPNYRQPAAYRRSCELLSGFDADWLLTAHFPVMGRDDAARFLSTSTVYPDLVERALVDELRHGGSRTTVELIGALQSSLGPWTKGAVDFGVASMLVGHLEEHLAAGRVAISRGRRGIVRWSIRPTREKNEQ